MFHENVGPVWNKKYLVTIQSSPIQIKWLIHLRKTRFPHMITRDSGIVREDLANTNVWNGTVQSVPTERAERYVCTPHQTNLCKTSRLSVAVSSLLFFHQITFKLTNLKALFVEELTNSP